MAGTKDMAQSLAVLSDLGHKQARFSTPQKPGKRQPEGAGRRLPGGFALIPG